MMLLQYAGVESSFNGGHYHDFERTVRFLRSTHPEHITRNHGTWWYSRAQRRLFVNWQCQGDEAKMYMACFICTCETTQIWAEEYRVRRCPYSGVHIMVRNAPVHVSAIVTEHVGLAENIVVHDRPDLSFPDLRIEDYINARLRVVAHDAAAEGMHQICDVADGWVFA